MCEFTVSGDSLTFFSRRVSMAAVLVKANEHRPPRLITNERRHVRCFLHLLLRPIALSLLISVEDVGFLAGEPGEDSAELRFPGAMPQHERRCRIDRDFKEKIVEVHLRVPMRYVLNDG